MSCDEFNNIWQNEKVLFIFIRHLSLTKIILTYFCFRIYHNSLKSWVRFYEELSSIPWRVVFDFIVESMTHFDEVVTNFIISDCRNDVQGPGSSTVTITKWALLYCTFVPKNGRFAKAEKPNKETTVTCVLLGSMELEESGN